MDNIIFRKEIVSYYSSKHKDFSLIKENPMQNDGDDWYRDYSKNPQFSIEKTYQDEETFVSNFANPMYSVLREYNTIVIESNGDKLSLKFFYGFKNRRVGKTWFKVSKNVDFLTVNKKTGDVYSGFLHNYQKKRKFTKNIRRNYFLNQPLSTITSKLKNILNRLNQDSSKIVNEIISVFLDNLSCPQNSLCPDYKLLRFYLDKKDYRYPNNFWLYTDYFIMPDFKKNLKKTQKNIVEGFMRTFELRGKKLKKYLHECSSLNIKNYLSAKKLFGENWLHQDGDFIKNILESSSTFTLNEDLKELLTPSEIVKVYQTFKNVIINKTIDGWSFHDHIEMYIKLKNYGELDLKWTTDGSDFKNFSEEHLDFTEKLSHYRNGTYTRYYPEYFVDSIEKQIDGYFPVILKNSSDYNLESLTQSNCVKGYIGRCGSIIVSLRKDSVDSLERATIEYTLYYSKNLETIHVDRIQTLGKYNQKLDSSWNEVLLKLDEIVLNCVKDKRFETVKIEKVCINSAFFNSESKFNDNGYLYWTKNINNFE